VLDRLVGEGVPEELTVRSYRCAERCGDPLSRSVTEAS